MRKRSYPKKVKIRNYITSDKFSKIEVDDKIKTRFMGICIVIEILDTAELQVRFINGPWKDQELSLIREQIAYVYSPSI